MRLRRIWPLVAAAASLLVGCAQYVDSPPATPVQLQTPACVGAAAPEPVRLPPDFTPIEALVCGEKVAGSARINPGAPYLSTRYRGDFTDAVAALNSRDRKKKGCDYSLIGLPELWLIDADGQGLIPRYPLDECGGPNTDGLNAILALPVVHQERFVSPPSTTTASPTLTFPIPTPGEQNPPPPSPPQPR